MPRWLLRCISSIFVEYSVWLLLNKLGSGLHVSCNDLQMCCAACNLALGLFEHVHRAGNVVVHLFQSIQTLIERFQQFLRLCGRIFLKRNEVRLLVVHVIRNVLDGFLNRG